MRMSWGQTMADSVTLAVPAFTFPLGFSHLNYLHHHHFGPFAYNSLNSFFLEEGIFFISMITTKIS